jgi:hypothetical protein
MSITPIDRSRLRHINQWSKRLDAELTALYHQAVKVRMPLETLEAIASLVMDLAAIKVRADTLRCQAEDAL